MVSTFKPCLLRETAEIALTEVKRFLEPRLMELFNLRRVSAPLFLPVGSPLLDNRHPGAVVHLGAANIDVEVVGSLDLWLRSQLECYPTAVGFGVFTIMNALRPDVLPGPSADPHVEAWSWQQRINPAEKVDSLIVAHAESLYSLLLDTEKMLLKMFPHMHPTLHHELEIHTDSDLQNRMPEHTRRQRIYRLLHPGRTLHPGERHNAALFLFHPTGPNSAEGEIWVWNRRVSTAVMVADIAVWNADGIGPASVGGNIFRNSLAMHLLHQDNMSAAGYCHSH